MYNGNWNWNFCFVNISWILHGHFRLPGTHHSFFNICSSFPVYSILCEQRLWRFFLIHSLHLDYSDNFSIFHQNLVFFYFICSISQPWRLPGLHTNSYGNHVTRTLPGLNCAPRSKVARLRVLWAALWGSEKQLSVIAAERVPSSRFRPAEWKACHAARMLGAL